MCVCNYILLYTACGKPMANPIVKSRDISVNGCKIVPRVAGL